MSWEKQDLGEGDEMSVKKKKSGFEIGEIVMLDDPEWEHLHGKVGKIVYFNGDNLYYVDFFDEWPGTEKTLQNCLSSNAQYFYARNLQKVPQEISAFKIALQREQFKVWKLQNGYRGRLALPSNINDLAKAGFSVMIRQVDNRKKNLVVMKLKHLTIDKYRLPGIGGLLGSLPKNKIFSESLMFCMEFNRKGDCLNFFVRSADGLKQMSLFHVGEWNACLGGNEDYSLKNIKLADVKSIEDGMDKFVELFSVMNMDSPLRSEFNRDSPYASKLNAIWDYVRNMRNEVYALEGRCNDCQELEDDCTCGRNDDDWCGGCDNPINGCQCSF